MTGISPTVESVLPQTSGGRRLLALSALVLLAVMLQVALLPYLRVADGTADLVVVAVAVAGWYRGPLVGTLAGFSAGLAVELSTPSGTLGVLALIYLAVGAFSGSFASGPRPSGIMTPLLRIMAVTALAQVALLLVQLLLGSSVSGNAFLTRVLVPSIALTVLVAPPFLALADRVMGFPRVVEPFMGG